MNAGQINIRVALSLVLLSILFSIAQPALADGPTLVRFAFFYKPPANADVTTLARTHDVFIFTRGDEELRDQNSRCAVFSNIFISTISSLKTARFLPTSFTFPI
ncbi:MAG: hypothetical protein ACP5QU_05200 [Anaerolineae bacterium]